MSVKTTRGARRKLKLKARSARGGRFVLRTKPARAGRAAARAIGAEIVAGLEEAVAFERGEAAGAEFKAAPITARHAEVLPAPSYTADDVLRIRKRLDVSQDVFAQALSVSPATVRSWEQNQKPPSGAARRLLQLADQHPELLLEQIRRTVHRGVAPR